MRIISGSLKGRVLIPPKTFKARPTTYFAKEGLFNMLEHNYDFSTLSVLDLFAGSGGISLGICFPELLLGHLRRNESRTRTFYQGHGFGFRD